MIKTLENLPGPVLGFAFSGQVSKADYDEVLIPKVLEALKSPGKLRLYFEIGPEFSGISPGAMWEDFLVGVEHLNRWKRLAVVTDLESIRLVAKFFGFLWPGMTKVFHVSDAEQARAWVAEGA